MDTKDDNNGTELLCLSWGQNYESFTVGTNIGFRSYRCDPFAEIYRCDFKDSGFAVVEMLRRQGTYVLVGVAAGPLFARNKVMIWNAVEGHCTCELVLQHEVMAVKMVDDQHLVVVHERTVCVYKIGAQKPLRQIETFSNPKGLCSVSSRPNISTMACLGLHRGRVRVEHLNRKETKYIGAHDSDIACLSLSSDGLLVATASTKGTLIRIFNTEDGTSLRELRRGADRAEIYSITFSPTAKWLAVSSDKGTVHIFSLNIQEVSDEISSASVGAHKICSNVSSSLSFMKGMLPKYFSSEWSFSQFHLPQLKQCIAAFGSSNTLVIVSMDGSFRRCSFDPVNGGKMAEEECFSLNEVDIKLLLPPDDVFCGY
ncbi:autophagy-related protein 18d-like [Typha angustifolia]|uniref:autophagy-related protein 18d-like n=1 Tax=Typha angustifolia TaxID=59011 RepID=UPI003C2EA609